jgi:hypothetical protein
MLSAICSGSNPPPREHCSTNAVRIAPPRRSAGIFQPLPDHRPDALPDRLRQAVPNLLGDPLAEQLHHRARADCLPAEPAAECEVSLAPAGPGARQTLRNRRANRFPEPLAHGVLESLTNDLTQAILHALDEPLLQRLTQPVANRRDDALRITARLCLRGGGRDRVAQPLAQDLLDDALANHIAEPLARRFQDALAELGLDPLADAHGDDLGLLTAELLRDGPRMGLARRGDVPDRSPSVPHGFDDPLVHGVEKRSPSFSAT